MGTFEKIRNASPWLLTAFAVVFILFMALADADIGGMMSAQQDPQNMIIGEVNGKEIRYVEYEKQVNQTIDQQRNTETDQQPNQKQIRRQIWNSYVEDLLLKEQAEKVGARVTDEVIAHEFLNNPPDEMKRGFMDSAGNFQKQAYTELLTDPEGFYAQNAPDMPFEERQQQIQEFRGQIIDFTEYYKDQKTRNFLTTAVNTAGGVISKNYAKRKYINENSKADVIYIEFPAANVSDDNIEISESDLKKYYEQNKESFKQDAKRKLKYVTFKIKPSANDSASAKKKVNTVSKVLSMAETPEERDSLFSERLRDYSGETVDYTIVNDLDQQLAPYIISFEKGDIKGPIRLDDGTYFVRLDDTREGENKVVEASHILIKHGDNKDSAKAAAQKIYSKAKSGGDFAQLAMTHSEDPGSARKGGDVGFFGEGQMVPEFEEAAFKADVGEIVGPVESQFGYHIIKKTDEKSLEYKYSYIKIAPMITGVTKNQILRDAYSFSKQLENGENLDSLADRLGIEAKETPAFTKDRPILSSQYLTDIAFKAKLNEVLEPLELDNYGIVVAQLSDIQKKGIALFENVKEEVRAKVKKQKALEYQLSEAKKIYENIKDAEMLTAVSEVNPNLNIKNAAGVKNNGTIPNGGKDVIFTSKIMDVPVGKIAQPFKGDKSVYIVQVTDRKIPSDEEVANALPNYIKQLKQGNQRNTYYLWLNKLKKDAEIIDNRHQMYKDY